MGVFGYRPRLACAKVCFRFVKAIRCYGVVAITAFALSSMAAADNERGSWRLIEFSVDVGAAVFADADGNLGRFKVADQVADRQWQIDSIAEDHLVLQSVRQDNHSTADAGIVLRQGDVLPDPAEVEPQASYYYQISGMVIEDIESDTVIPDGEDR